MMPSRFRLSFVLALLMFGFPAFAGVETGKPTRVLFVGNSLTYVGNLPAVLEALATANGNSIESEMLVRGGATLSDRARDGSVRKLLGTARYDFVVLQERGGDVLCFNVDRVKHSVCESTQAHLDLARIAATRGARPIILGTYQEWEQASQAIEGRERALARTTGAVHIPVSERFRRLRAESAAKNWFHEDGMHPGHDLVLLEAIWLYREIFKSTPRPHDLVVTRPMFGPNARFDGAVPASAQSPAAAMKPYRYDQREVSEMIRSAIRTDPQVH